MKKNRNIPLLLLLAALLSASCRSDKYLGQGDYLLHRVQIKSDSSKINISELSGLIQQRPNARWFSTIKLPLGFYLLTSPNHNNRLSRTIRRIGEAPVIYDTLSTILTTQKLQQAIRNQGYLHATVTSATRTNHRKINVTYTIHPHQRYTIDTITTDILDTTLTPFISQIATETHLHPGMPIDITTLSAERNRISNHLTDNGFYRFSHENITYTADTTQGTTHLNLHQQITPYTNPITHKTTPFTRYRMGLIHFTWDTIPRRHPIHIRPKVLYSTQQLHSGNYYSQQNIQDTYARLSRLPAIAATNIRLREDTDYTDLINADIHLTPARINSLTFGLDGTNTAGDLGVSANVTYQNRNLFHGSEVLSVKLRGAFEAIRGLSGYADQNYIEYSLDISLRFPSFKFPILGRRYRWANLATSEFSVTFDSQDRPEFHRRVLTGGWRYTWTNTTGRGSRHQNRIDLLDVDYVFMPWISDTFYDRYIKNPHSRNAIIAYNYKNLFIVRWGYQWHYSSIGTTTPQGIYHKNAYTIRASIETAGNLLHAITAMYKAHRNTDGQREFLGIAYAQYVKADIDFSRSIRFNRRTSLALHAGLGIAVPYANSNILPYEKRYFSGGANSVRGWSVRSLGPGSFSGTNGQIDFINQTGDLKLDLNAEFRAKLFWKLDGALFLDAGNIWTLRDYKDQPGGQFTIRTCWEQIALAYGLGLRLNFNYFILRFDGGMKAINPAEPTTSDLHYPLLHPNFHRDFTFHFAVGLPF